MSEYRELTPKLHVREMSHQSTYIIWCPGCREPHGFPVRKDPNDGVPWKFNGNLEAPTFTPSLLHPHKPRCHLHVTAGQIIYCADCDHALAGKTVEMVPIDEARKA